MKAKVGLIFSVMPKEKPTWPYKGYDYATRVKKLSSLIRENLPDVDFVEQVLRSPEEFDEEKFKGVKVFAVVLVGIWNGVARKIIESGKPVLLVDDLYGGSGEFLQTLGLALRKGYRVAGVASSNLLDSINAIKVLSAIDLLSKSRILVVKELEEERFNVLKENVKRTVGSELVLISPEKLISEYEKTSPEEARKIAEKWIEEALELVEPSEEEVVKSAKMYLAMKKLIEKYGAQAITIDCLGLFYRGKLPAYPCLGYVELLNRGYVATCEADIDSAITQLLIQYITGRPGFVSDPVLDQGSGYIIYAHCLAATKVYGPKGPRTPYRIRSHSEDRAGAALQAYWPSGEPITTVKLNLARRAMALHSGIIRDNIEEEKACRTKVAAEIDVDKIMYNWNRVVDFGWHRVSVVGNFKREFKLAARLLGFQLIEEDS